MQQTGTNQIARLAAELLVEDSTSSIDQAVQSARSQLGLLDVPLPSRGLVRQHCRAWAQAVLGEQGYKNSIKEKLVVIAQLADSLLYLQPEIRIMVMGRAAQSLFDGPGRVHLRLFTDDELVDLAERLVTLGYEEPSFHTVDTQYGRMTQLHFRESTLDFCLTMIRSSIRFNEQEDLFTGKQVASVQVQELRAMIQELS
ncbi:MAG: hypothetical protein P8J86_12480 [Phycisphaerales bacterium]|nr:hypothetical protein [Phycisphaerales bacterium]